MNETTQQEKTTQLVSRNETTQLCTAVDCLQQPATTCTAFTAESAFSTYSQDFGGQFTGPKREIRRSPNVSFNKSIVVRAV
ncbi:hypothetical protein TNCV_4369501 [Trichonephila clavipes]|nr:hypothetical protein TNCV_4369501 [Trichonephila clavipes]